jgi:hypothetical protein
LFDTVELSANNRSILMSYCGIAPNIIPIVLAHRASVFSAHFASIMQAFEETVIPADLYLV